jgi:hypothetical protein
MTQFADADILQDCMELDRSGCPGGKGRRALVLYPSSPGPAGETTRLTETYRWRLARLLHVSRTGIDLLLGRRFEPGTALSIVVAPYELPARVAQVTARGDGNWLIACELLVPLREEQLEALQD